MPGQVTPAELADPIQFLADSSFSWGSLAAIRYDRTRTDLFPEPYLVDLYLRCKQAGRGKLGRLGLLPSLFCGMRDLSCEAIVQYLYQLPVIAVGEWRERITVLMTDEATGLIGSYTPPAKFHTLGFCFPTAAPLLAAQQHQSPANPHPPNAIFAGYCFFDEAWRTPQQTVLMYLGLGYLFHEFRLAAIHGVRYSDNHLTARFTRKFGFEDRGQLDYYLYRHDTGLLGPAMIATLTRETFADSLSRVLLQSLRDDSADSSSVAAAAAEPDSQTY